MITDILVGVSTGAAEGLFRRVDLSFMRDTFKRSLAAVLVTTAVVCLQKSSFAQGVGESLDARPDARLTLAPEKGGLLPGEALAGK